MELLDYEKKHIDYLLNNAHECCLFLKRNNEFPLEKPCKVVLVGNGARQTIKGGTGSGDVASRFFANAEQGLEKAGFEIVSKKWIDFYDEFKKSTWKNYVKDTKRLAKKNHYFSFIYQMGFFEEEKNYDFSCDYEGDACIYVLARNSGEGNDRRNIKGDVKLSDKEVEDILFLNKKFKKFMLVLNVGGVIDLSEVQEVENILLLSQLGVVTGDILANIILGKSNPSGKLTTTWAKPEDYPSFNYFGDLHDTEYKEGIYVGYRYFSTISKQVFYPFGYGLSYTDFNFSLLKASLDKTKVCIDIKVENVGKFDGKETIQIYVSKPNERINQPMIELCGYEKTKEIKPHNSQVVSLFVDITKCTTFDVDKKSNILLKGNYLFSIGNSSANLVNALIVNVEEDIVVDQLDNKCGNSKIKDLMFNYERNTNLNVPVFKLNKKDIQSNIVIYKKDEYTHPLMETLTNDELALVCVGHHDSGIAALVGNSCEHVYGGAGETVLKIDKINKSLTMCDGPAGIRIIQTYGVDKKGKYSVVVDPMLKKLAEFLPAIAKPFIIPSKSRKGEIFHQYTTAIPIGTALAQSFNKKFLEECGNIIGEEMEIFGVDLWLAPALNIHRNILCGRNFEYYSEDPYVSGIVAANITSGVQKHKGKGVTIKHFACNNQEINRNNTNVIISERTLREIYLKGFEICINESNPASIMTSYNLVNGVHTSEYYELINDILRCEWKYDGLVMSDWIASGRSFCLASKYPAPYASNNILAGNDLTMPGCKADDKDIKKALRKGKLTRQDLLYSASRIYNFIERMKNE